MPHVDPILWNQDYILNYSISFYHFCPIQEYNGWTQVSLPTSYSWSHIFTKFKANNFSIRNRVYCYRNFNKYLQVKKSYGYTPTYPLVVLNIFSNSL
jgi:hypothetical protein